MSGRDVFWLLVAAASAFVLIVTAVIGREPSWVNVLNGASIGYALGMFIERGER